MCLNRQKSLVAFSESSPHDPSKYYTVHCGTLCRLLYGLVAGTWADAHGRKMLILLSVLGQLLATLSYALNYLLLLQLPWQFLYLELVNDLCGNYVSYYLAIYSFIACIASQDSRLDS